MNKDDQKEINNRLKSEYTQGSQLVVNGSGVDLSYFSYQPLPKKGINFLFIGRLIKSKGIVEFYNAAKKIKADFPTVTFTIVGDIERNADVISNDLLVTLKNSRDVAFIGSVSDVRPYLRDCHIFVLPSYREGLPRSVLEALATGRAVITTDAPGCRETVIENKNGFLVQTADEESLITSMSCFITNRHLISEFGSRSRRLAEEKFSDKAVADDIANFI